MNWFVNAIAGFVRSFANLLRRRDRQRQRLENLYDSGGDRQAITRPLVENSDGRKRAIYAIGPRASSDGIGGESEYFTYLDEKGTQTEIDYRITRRCDCGALIGYRDVSLLGTCGICARTVCNQEGCAARCERCSMLVCGTHTVRLGNRTFCSRHRWYGLWMMFWGLLK